MLLRERTYVRTYVSDRSQTAESVMQEVTYFIVAGDINLHTEACVVWDHGMRRIALIGLRVNLI